jgi:hypothetical protein
VLLVPKENIMESKIMTCYRCLYSFQLLLAGMTNGQSWACFFYQDLNWIAGTSSAGEWLDGSGLNGQLTATVWL